MKIFIAAVLASIVSAQNLTGEPACAVPCLQSAIAESGCALNDQGCQCGSGQAAIQTAVTPCLISNCSSEDLGTAASVGLALCAAYSATAFPNATATTGLSGSNSTVGASTTTVGSNATIATSAPKTTASSTAAKTTQASGTEGSNGGATVSTTSSSKAGAPTMLAQVGGVVGMVAVMVAAL